MSTTQAPAASLYPDRSTTLIVAGVFEFLLGCLCALLAAMMVAVKLLGPMAQPPQGHAMNPAALVQAMVLYGLLAAAFLWVGIGLVRARRWA
jgi:predicted cobalt transporter CbtA